jgi:hypothetical protein
MGSSDGGTRIGRPDKCCECRFRPDGKSWSSRALKKVIKSTPLMPSLEFDTITLVDGSLNGIE